MFVLRNSFWIIITVSAILCFIAWLIWKGNKNNNKILFAPALFCVGISILSFISILITAFWRWHMGLAVLLMHTFWVFVFTLIGRKIILLIERYTNKH